MRRAGPTSKPPSNDEVACSSSLRRRAKEPRNGVGVPGKAKRDHGTSSLR